MKPIIEVEHLSKQYRLGTRTRYLSLRDSLTDLGKKLLSTTHSSQLITHNSFWALDDVSFTVEAGESVGIIGRNGAGKSTLLKILSRITPPTKGRAILRGRLASLLEVGTGFHPELSGRENVFMNGSILGLKRAEIAAKFDEIVAFSGVEQFIDTPLKNYSSGMQLRLAFAVAAHLEPEILIIDEVLAVGDAEFQKKCLGKMDEVSRSGRTVLFVSHNLSAVQQLCTRGIYLEQGKIILNNTIENVINKYLDGQNKKTFSDFKDTDSGDMIARVKSIKLVNMAQGQLNDLTVSDVSQLEISFEIMQERFKPLLSIHISTMKGEDVFASIDNSFQKFSTLSVGIYTSFVTIPHHFLNNRTYVIDVHLTTLNPVIKHALIKEVIIFEVQDDLKAVTRQGYTGFFHGVIRPKLNWHHKKD